MCRNGRIVAIPSGELIFYGLGTGEYNELAREMRLWQRQRISFALQAPCALLSDMQHACTAGAVAEVLRTLIGVYTEAFRVPALSDALLFSNYAQTILVVDEVCKEVSRSAAAAAAAWCACSRRPEGDVARGAGPPPAVASLQGLVEHLDKQSIFKAVSFKVGGHLSTAFCALCDPRPLPKCCCCPPD